MNYHLGVDVGGTFTDLVLYDVDTNHIELTKTPSTPSNQAEGVTTGIEMLLKRIAVPASNISFLIHGTTVATNTLLERKGASTALIVTEGFRDVLEVGRQDRPDLYDWRIRKTTPLVPRHLRFEIKERILYTGEIHKDLDLEALHRLVETIRGSGAESVAVCLMHSYANPKHEIEIGQTLQEHLPDLPVSLSHQILPEFKEFERMSTTVINSYVSPVIGTYVNQLTNNIVEAGISSNLYIMQSNGGTMRATSAVERPVNTILSGPAAGVIGSVAISKQASQMNAICVDMGGTSFDVTLAHNGEVRQTRESEIERLPIKVPMVDIHTLGAGGGSIAWIDPGGALRVGPKSSGADPGPACYGKGGKEPTVTDANLVLGRLNPSRFLGGRMSLDTGLARSVIDERLAKPLGLSIEACAEGIIRVVNASMIKGIRVVSVAKGFDPRDFCLVAFGGAGPVHSSELASELDIPKVLVPIAPGVTSALGLLMADLRHDFVQTVLKSGDSLDHNEINSKFATMEDEAVQRMQQDGVPAEQVTLLRMADIRYAGQGYELEIPINSGKLTKQSMKNTEDQFHMAHERMYGYSTPDRPIEAVNLRITALTELPRPKFVPQKLVQRKNPEVARDGQRNVYFNGRFVETFIYYRPLLQPGDCINGPAVIEQEDSTTLVWEDQIARVDAFSNLLVERV